MSGSRLAHGSGDSACGHVRAAHDRADFGIRAAATVQFAGSILGLVALGNAGAPRLEVATEAFRLLAVGAGTQIVVEDKMQGARLTETAVAVLGERRVIRYRIDRGSSCGMSLLPERIVSGGQLYFGWQPVARNVAIRLALTRSGQS